MNILILTSIYPQKDDEENIGVTPVVEYFAKEWGKVGHNVIVIHNSSRYPRALYFMPDSWLNKINSKLGIVIPNRKQGKKLCNKNEGLTSYRLPMLKIIPKNRYSDAQVERQYKEIITILKKEKFNPDIILGHWENPQIPLLSMLKRRFGVITGLVFHGIVYLKQQRYRSWAKKFIDDIDVIGARSSAIAKDLKELLSLKEEPFICYSGIADKYFETKKYNELEFRDKIPNSYLYVGRLIKRKNVNVSISALKKVYKNNKFVYNIVGKGAESIPLMTLSSDLKLENSIKFLGYKERDEVIDIMSETEVFIMISDNETFGLVYIEAMSRGCIVVASKNGGMDGIILDGFNGFLCEQGNEDELITICNKINKMSLEEKIHLSKNAIMTASHFKDSEVAQRYLDSLINYRSKTM